MITNTNRLSIESDLLDQEPGEVLAAKRPARQEPEDEPERERDGDVEQRPRRRRAEAAVVRVA